MQSQRGSVRRKEFLDFIRLLGLALLVIGVGVGAFVLAASLHIDSKWVLLLWVAVGFFAAVGWDFRENFKTASFVLFFAAWLVVYISIFIVVMMYLGWIYWLLATFVELFLFYVTAYWLFGLDPPLRRRR